jgi:transposase-like protein
MGTPMRAKFYPDELKAEAVRLVIEKRYSAAEVASAFHLRSETVQIWVKRFRDSRSRLGEVAQLKSKLHEVVMERDVLIELTTRLLDKTG